jgi:hypothetical protein
MGRLRKLRCPQFHWLWRLCVPFVGRALAHADRGRCHGRWPDLRVRCSINTLCCSRVLISTKRNVERVTASQIASASAASFYRLCPMMTASSAMTLTHIKTGRSWESALARARWHPRPAHRNRPRRAHCRHRTGFAGRCRPGPRTARTAGPYKPKTRAMGIR